MALTNNILQQVQTYQRSGLAYLLNLNCFVSSICNTKFKDFENFGANLGSTVTFDLPPRFTTGQGLVWNYQPAVQRVQTLSASQSANVPFAFTAQERIFNVEKDTENYMREFGRSAIHELSNSIEIDVAKNANSSVTNQITNQMDPTSGPTRFFGDAVTAITSFQQLAQAITNFKNFGAVQHGIKFILPDMVIPSIVGSGLNQFVPHRNDEIAMSWEVGEFGTPPVTYYQSNLLPIQNAGTVGNAGRTLTLVSTNDPTGQNVTQLTFSDVTTTDPNSINYGDMLQFQDGVTGQPNMRLLTFIGHVPSSQPVQFRATAAAGTVANTVVINIAPALVWAQGANQNLNNPLAAGMQVKALPSHRCGLIVGGDAFFLALPALPDQRPFDSYSEYDESTGVSIRFATGSQLGQNLTGFGYDAVWGSTLVPEYSMRVAIPLSQA